MNGDTQRGDRCVICGKPAEHRLPCEDSMCEADFSEHTDERGCNWAWCKGDGEPCLWVKDGTPR